jgi:hypothetical protein
MFKPQSRIPEIFKWLRAWSDHTIDCARCLEELCRILRDELDVVGAELNTRNYAQVVFRIAYAMATGSTDGYKIKLINDHELPNDAEKAAFRACSVLMGIIQHRTEDNAIKAAAVQLHTYIEEMGYLPEFYVECGDRVA